MIKRIAIDIETTGQSPGEDEILQIGIVDHDSVLFFSDISPERNFCWDASSAAYGTTSQMVADAPTMDGVLDSVQGVVDQADEVVFYDPSTSLPFLEAAGVSFEGVVVVDAMASFLGLKGGCRPGHSAETRPWPLSSIAEHVGYLDFDQHDAVESAMAICFVQEWCDVVRARALLEAVPYTEVVTLPAYVWREVEGEWTRTGQDRDAVMAKALHAAFGGKGGSRP